METVEDAHGGVTIYYQGHPTHYLLAGEWYRALPAPGSDFADQRPPARG